jgi:DNA-binding NarL/FixJ family response regulator
MLTKREQEILKFVAKGFTIDEISKVLNISISTVVTHKQNIQEKLKAKNSCNAIFIYFSKNLETKS